MLRLFRSNILRNQLAGNLSTEKFAVGVNASWLSNSTSRLSFSAAGSNFSNSESYSGKTYADFAIFKGKAALSAYPVLPRFSKIKSGSIVEKRGVLMLKFIPAVGQRKYDNEKKQMFALSAVEVGSLISLGPTESCEFFHDPSMKSSMEGQVKKTLSVSPLNSDGGGYFFNLSVLNSAKKTTERFTVPVTKAEFAVMRTAFGYALPHIMGWDQAVAPQFVGSGAPPVRQKEPEMRLDPDYEWGR